MSTTRRGGAPQPGSRRGLAAVAVFALALAVYIATGPGYVKSVDVFSELSVAQSIVDHHDFHASPGWPNVTGVDGGSYSVHGVGQPILFAAAVAIGEHLPPQASGSPQEFAVSFVDALFGALIVLLLFLFAQRLGATRTTSLALALVSGFGTILWPYARDGFDNGPTAFFLPLALYGAYRARVGDGLPWAVVSGFAGGFAVALRIPSVIVLCAIGVYLVLPVGNLRSNIRRCVAWGLPVLLFAILIGWFNEARFGNPLETGYSRLGATGFTTPIQTGLAGLLVSPGKSIFLYSPPLLLALAGFRAFFRRCHALALVIAATVLVYVPFHALYDDWRGGWAWGPRLLVPVVPLMMLPAVEVLGRWRARPVLERFAIATSVAAGVVVQLLSVTLDWYHQIAVVLQDEGVPIDATDWDPKYSAIWRHAQALWEMLTSVAPYPQRFTGWDIASGRPVDITWDFWWNYALANPALRAEVYTVLTIAAAVAVLATVVLTRQLSWTSSRRSVAS